MGFALLVVLASAISPVASLADEVFAEPVDLDVSEVELGPRIAADTNVADAEAQLHEPRIIIRTPMVTLDTDEPVPQAAPELHLPLPVPRVRPNHWGIVMDNPYLVDDEDTSVAGHGVLMPGAVATANPLPSSSTAGLASEAATVAAMAGLAVYQAQPRFHGLRRYFPVAALYARIPRERVLEHPTRSVVYQQLRDQPGLSLEEVSRRLVLSRSTARHHLRVLEDAGLIRHAIEGRCRIHFPTGFQQVAVEQHLTDHPQRARILELVGERPYTLLELGDVLEANPGAVHFHLVKLVDGGLVERIDNGSVVYRAVGSPVRGQH